jgi:hypothetical protein
MQLVESGEGEMYDFMDAKEVEVSIRSDGKVVWINIDGACRVRCYRPEYIKIDDRRHDAQ